MIWAEITRDTTAHTVDHPTAPDKIRDALETFLNQVAQALAEDGMDPAIARDQVDTLHQPLTDIVRGANDRIVDTWEQIITDQENLDSIFDLNRRRWER